MQDTQDTLIFDNITKKAKTAKIRPILKKIAELNIDVKLLCYKQLIHMASPAGLTFHFIKWKDSAWMNVHASVSAQTTEKIQKQADTYPLLIYIIQLKLTEFI